MHEILDLDARALAEKRELGERHLAADDDARDAVFLEFLDGMLVVRIHHDGRVQRDGDAELMHELEHGEVLHEERVRPDFLKILEIFLQLRNLLVADEVVERDVEAHIMGMGIVDGLLQQGVIEIEIALVHAHVEMLAAEIDGIGAGFHIGDERVPSAGRCEELYRFSRQDHENNDLFSYVFHILRQQGSFWRMMVLFCPAF